jgi:acyl carrier protein
MNTIEQLTGVFRTVFDDPDIQLKPETIASDIEGWDSLSHVNLIMAIEKSFKIRFNQKELMTFQRVGDMIRCLDSKLPKA